MSESVKMVIRDTSKFGLVPTQAKLDLIRGAIATVNVMAGRGRKEAVANVQRNFINRNTYTVRQIQFTPMPESKYIKISAIRSFLGATEKAPYMQRQEEGGKHTPSKGQTLAIPTDVARGGSKRRAVASSMRVSKLNKRRRVRSPTSRDYSFWFRSEKARKVSRAYIAFKKNLLLPIGDTGGQRNLFVVTKFVKNRKGVAFLLKQVYKFDKQETTTKPEPWLLPASEKVARQVQAIFNAQMKKIEK
jgi:hypothetical protein